MCLCWIAAALVLLASDSGVGYSVCRTWPVPHAHFAEARPAVTNQSEVASPAASQHGQPLLFSSPPGALAAAAGARSGCCCSFFSFVSRRSLSASSAARAPGDFARHNSSMAANAKGTCRRDGAPRARTAYIALGSNVGDRIGLDREGLQRDGREGHPRQADEQPVGDGSPCTSWTKTDSSTGPAKFVRAPARHFGRHSC